MNVDTHYVTSSYLGVVDHVGPVVLQVEQPGVIVALSYGEQLGHGRHVEGVGVEQVIELLLLLSQLLQGGKDRLVRGRVIVCVVLGQGRGIVKLLPSGNEHEVLLFGSI